MTLQRRPIGGLTKRLQPRTAIGTSRLVLIVYVGAMIAMIVGLDLAFFQRILERLMLNAGTVFAFAAFHLRFLRAS